jgi:tetratricopeptide (TPR) repeat protein
MKAIFRMLALTVIVGIGVTAQSWAQSAEELENAGLRHFKKGFYEHIPQKEAAKAAEEFQKAEAALRKAIEQNPDRASAYVHLGRTLFVQEKYREAAEMYGFALEIEPGNKPLYLQLASAQELAGNYRGAVATLWRLRDRETDPEALEKLDDLIERLEARQDAPGPQEATPGKGGGK